MKTLMQKVMAGALTVASLAGVASAPMTVLASEDVIAGDNTGNQPYVGYKQAQLYACSGEVNMQLLVRNPSNIPMTEIEFKSGDKHKVTVYPVNGYTLGIKPGDTKITVTYIAPEDDYTTVSPIRVEYADVRAKSTNDYWYDATYHLTNKNIVDGYKGKSAYGYDQYTFKPHNSCTRAQMVTFLWRLAKQPGSKLANPYKDVKSSDYFYKAVLWATEKGITTGTSKTTFDPQGACTRAQTVTFLWRLAGKPEPKVKTTKFKDIKTSDYFYKAVLWATEKGITTGTTSTAFNPQGKCSRAQMVTFLYRYDVKVLKNPDLGDLNARYSAKP